MGRRIREVKLIDETSQKQVTFSKRKAGLFKKAHELAMLCAAQVAIILFSPSGNSFAFGHPKVDTVVHRFLGKNPEDASSDTDSDDDDDDEAHIQRMNEKYNKLRQKLHEENERGKKLKMGIKSKGKQLLTTPVEEHSLEELKELKETCERLKEDLKLRSDELEASSALLLLAEKPVFMKDLKPM